jgi:hypothetical protein
MQGDVRERDPYPSELRDVLDGMRLASGGSLRADILVTRDADVIAYGARLGYIATTLPWTLTYVLVPARPNASGAIPSVGERAALARDAVTSDARGATEPFAWLTDTACTAVVGKPSAEPRAVIAYRAGDSTAKQIAERIVALAGGTAVPPWISSALGMGTVATPRVAAFRGDSIYRALESGAASGAVIPILRDARDACGTDANDRVSSGSVPLIDERAHVLVRRGSGAAFVITPDGVLHFFRHDTR